MSQRPITLTIAALGGQGGGVLTDWLIQIAEAEHYLVQSTSVPGVAQRTGATIYYLEFFPRAAAERERRDPVMALMPVPGDVDCVIASELAEAARAVQRGLVTPGRTTLIASSHRSYTIAEKSAMGDGAADSSELLKLAREHARRLVLFDMEALAASHASVISSVMLGALSGSGVLPFRKTAFAAAIQRGGIAVETNLAAFEAAHEVARQGDAPLALATPPAGRIPQQARTAELQPLLDRVHRLPAPVQPVVFEGVRRAIDYQDPAYAALYLDRVDRMAALEVQQGRTELLEAAARGLALWMTFEDTIRVADLKTRGSRFDRIRSEVHADRDQLIGITEFMKPRVAEIAGTMPAALGRRVLASERVSRWLGRWSGGKQIRTGTLSGFLLLYLLAGMRRWRRGTLRFHEENARLESWLVNISRLAPANYALAVELARAQRLIKGYGDTHERGWKNFCALTNRLDVLAARPDGAARLAQLQKAALSDEEGSALARELAAL
ncbi:MAG: indolepyruvate oxidoreductase subunit beta family protein [Gammaproteobacteria bacterium]